MTKAKHGIINDTPKENQKVGNTANVKHRGIGVRNAVLDIGQAICLGMNGFALLQHMHHATRVAGYIPLVQQLIKLTGGMLGKGRAAQASTKQD